jgi:hypothetical protein
MRQFEQDCWSWAAAWRAAFQDPRNLRLLRAAQAELRWATATTTRATRSSSQ